MPHSTGSKKSANGTHLGTGSAASQTPLTQTNSSQASRETADMISPARRHEANASTAGSQGGNTMSRDASEAANVRSSNASPTSLTGTLRRELANGSIETLIMDGIRMITRENDDGYIDIM